MSEDEAPLRDPETGGILLSHVAGDPEAMLAALLEFADRDAARIGYDHLSLDGAEVEVSTVDLVWTAPGGAYETMVFLAHHGPVFAQRYRTRDTAAAGHDEVVAGLRAGLLDDRLARTT